MDAVATTWKYAKSGLHALSTGCPAIECPGRAVMVTLVIPHIEALPKTVIVVSVVDETLLMYSIDDVKCRLWLELRGHVLLFRLLLLRFLLFRLLLFRFLLLSFNGNLLLLRLLMMGFDVDILLIYFLLFEFSLSIFNESCRLSRLWLIRYDVDSLLMVSTGLGCHMTEIIAVRDDREGTAVRQLLGWHNHC
jgi:hypothetical protein